MSLSDSIEENPPPFVSPLLTSTPSGTPMWSDNERQEVEDPEEKIRNARQKVKDLKKKIRNAIKIRKVEEVTLFWKRRCEEAEVRLAKLREELKKATEEEYEARQQLREEHMKRFVVPTVTKILRQAVYEKEAGIAGSVECICGRGDEPERIRAQKHKFIEIGFENDEDVDAFAECWPGVMERYCAALSRITGDEVVEALPYCGDEIRPELETAFEQLWGISPDDWPNATDAQNALIIRNRCLSKVDRLG